MTRPPDTTLHCPDDGVCHHECESFCFRVVHASPLSSYRYKGRAMDDWPGDVLERHVAIAENHRACADGWIMERYPEEATFVWPCGRRSTVPTGPHTTRPYPEFVANLHDRAGQIDPAERGGRTGNAHPSTSRRAAVHVRRGTQLSALLAIVAAAGRETGVTCFEATDVMRRMLERDDLSRNQVATRMGELAERGLVARRRANGFDAEHYVERATEGAATACVWFVTDAGVDERERLRRAV